MKAMPDAAGKQQDPEQIKQELLELLQRLYAETRAGQTPTEITLDSSLDRDLGFDSLTRAELLIQVERTFGIGVSEHALARLETPRDLLRMILHSSGQVLEETPSEFVAPAGAVDEPAQAHTLQDVLLWHAKQHPQRPHLYLYHESGSVDALSYGELWREAEVMAAGLQHHGLEPGQTIALMLPTSREYFFCFFGVLLAGGIPVPIYPPARPSQLEDHLRRHAGILDNAGATMLITIERAKAISRLLQLHVPSLHHVLTPTQLAAHSDTSAEVGAAKALDIALLQYTSGSTGNPKGVILTHANLLANIRTMGKRIQVEPSDVFVSWLPLYHDMGLIGAWLGSLYFAIPLVVMSPLLFLARPERWLWAIHTYKGTLSAAPNFAYELCLRKVEDARLQELDLSSWRIAFNGAEAISPVTLRNFIDRFSRHGFRPGAMAPVYGLAESSVGLAFPAFGREPKIDRVQREALMQSGRAEPAAADDTHAVEFVSVGQPLPGHQVRIVDETGRELPERQEGCLEFKGPSATTGYYRNPQATKRLFHGDWLDTGDRGYMVGGDLFITGRNKDLIIKAGRNIYPHELEEAVSNIEGIRKGAVAVFASHDSKSRTEQLVVMAECTTEDDTLKEKLRRQIVDRTVDLLGMPPDVVKLVAAHSVPKTSSGKIRRAASRELYESGRIGLRQHAPWRQVLVLLISGIRPQLRQGKRWLVEFGYAGWFWSMFWLLAPFIWTGVILAPKRRQAQAVMRHGTRTLLRLIRTPVHVEGEDQLPRDTPCILVSNHASYFDGLVLSAVLPIPFSFVAKGELHQRWLVRPFLQRLGAQLVERFDLQQGVADAQRIANRVMQGDSILFFPEGTLSRVPGLRSFHMGAFTAAVDAGVPVVPITLKGTRSKLRDGSWFPRRGGVQVIIGQPLYPRGEDWAAAVQLRDRSRERILERCGEPDLAHEEKEL